MDLIVFSMISGVIGLFFAALMLWRVSRFDKGTKEMQEISSAIRQGAMTFLRREYITLGLFALVIAVLLAIFIHPLTGISYIIGAICSVLAGFLGMYAATGSNAATAWAAKQDIGKALQIAFSGGAVLGLSVVGLGMFGLAGVYLILAKIFGGDIRQVIDVIAGFGFGASSVALFARVGGGIYTKGADVGADLVGKVEVGIPEDDPRNPAVIADNVGDNVGDIAGMGADLFESYIASLIGAMTVGVIVFRDALGAALPFTIQAAGILATIIGIYFVRPSKKKTSSFQEQTKNARKTLNKGTFSSVILATIATYVIMRLIENQLPEDGPSAMGLFFATLLGIISGLFIAVITEYYTSDEKAPVRGISTASQTGAATNIIAGLAVGMKSTGLPIIIVGAALFFAHKFAGLFGIPMAAVGLQATIGMVLAVDGYGPITDNAAGIAEMAHMGRETRERAEALDSVGNTTAAIGKGFAISAAAFSTFALFWAYTEVVGIETIPLNAPVVIFGLFIGGLLPVVFSSFSLNAVGKAGFDMVKEVRRQFKEIPGLMEGTAKPDYEKCVDISTRRALREMILPGILAVSSPIVVGFLLGPNALGGMLIGSIVTGFLLAVWMANSGGAWDNAKKYIEAGNLGGKGSESHKAAVVGDTVGDPFKDTAGPSLNILIKLVSIIALIIAPLLTVH